MDIVTKRNKLNKLHWCFMCKNSGVHDDTMRCKSCGDAFSRVFWVLQLASKAILRNLWEGSLLAFINIPHPLHNHNLKGKWIIDWSRYGVWTFTWKKYMFNKTKTYWQVDIQHLHVNKTQRYCICKNSIKECRRHRNTYFKCLWCPNLNRLYSAFLPFVIGNQSNWIFPPPRGLFWQAMHSLSLLGVFTIITFAFWTLTFKLLFEQKASSTGINLSLAQQNIIICIE